MRGSGNLRMHLAIIIDEKRLWQEQAMLNRLCIALAAEGAQVTRIVPDSIESEAAQLGEQRMALLPRIETSINVLPWTRRRRTDRLVAALEDAAPDVFYAVGQKAWGIGLDLSAAMQRPVAIDLWAMDLVRQVPRGHHAERIGGYVVPTKSMAEALKIIVHPEMISVVPLGVAAPTFLTAKPLPGQSDEPTVAVIGGARDMPAYQAMLSGLSRVARELPALQIFLELRGPHEHDIWKHARKLDLLDAISALGEASQYRALLTHCDLMLLPERFGELRTIMLEAMALGVPIIASEGTRLDPLVADQTAIFVRQTDPESWSQQVRRLLTNEAESTALGEKARQAVLANHRSSDQVAGLMTALESMVAKDSLKFPRSDGNGHSGPAA